MLDDQVVRAMTDDGAFRVIAARTTNTVDRAVCAQRATGSVARQFGELLTGAVLYRETMAPDLRVQSILKGAQGGSLVADSHPSGSTRGLVTAPPENELKLGSGAFLRVMRSLPGGRIQQGVVAVPEARGISSALMAYMQTSEQVVSMLAVGTILVGGAVLAAGGYLVQLLPEVGRAPLAVMTERLKDFEDIDVELHSPSFSTHALLDELLHGMPFTFLDERTVDFGCWCSEVRVVSALSTLSRRDVEELLRPREVLDVSCDYCGKEYRVPPEQLRGLLDAS